VSLAAVLIGRGKVNLFGVIRHRQPAGTWTANIDIYDKENDGFY